MSSRDDGGPAFPRIGEGMGDPKYDVPGMTLRQYAAIKLRVPDSGIDWLDEMIFAAKRDELAARLIPILSGENAYARADGMLAQRSKP